MKAIHFIPAFLCLYFSWVIIQAKDAEMPVENAADSVSNQYPIDVATRTASKSQLTTPTSQNLPVESSSFEVMRSEGMVYVDKTAFIEKILNLKNKFLFLTRPRRFGKTTFLEMLEHYYLGDIALFNDTYIAMRMPGNWTKYPVIRISLNFKYSIDDLDDIKRYKKDFEERLRDIGEDHGLGRKSSGSIASLIRNLRKKYGQPVVVLIDEYDRIYKRCTTKDETVFVTLKNTVTAFYEQLKDQERDIKLVFITGVSRLSLDCLGSGLNNILDLTFDKDFSSAMGFTLDEITSNFGPSLQSLAAKEKVKYPAIIEKLTKWYDGYRFSLEDDKTRVFNPISVIKTFINLKIRNYWARTANIELAITRMKKTETEVEEFFYYPVKSNDLAYLYDDEFSSKVPLAILLHNYGYLTILKYNIKSDTVFLGYPNAEIEEIITTELLHSSYEPVYDRAMNNSIREEDMDHFVKFLNRKAFRKYSRLPIKSNDEFSLTKHILNAMVDAKLGAVYNSEMIVGSDRNLKGDVDIAIKFSNSIPKSLPVDTLLTIEVRFRKSVIDAILQLVGYVVKSPIPFQQTLRRCLKKDVVAYTQLLAIRIDDAKEKDNQHLEITEWISMPYRLGKIYVNEMQTNVKNSLDQLKNGIRRMKSGKTWTDEHRKLLDKTLIWNGEITNSETLKDADRGLTEQTVIRSRDGKRAGRRKPNSQKPKRQKPKIFS